MAITLGLVINLQFIQFIFYAATHSRFTLFFYHFFLSLMYVLLFFTFLSLFATFARFLALRISVSVSLSVCAVFVVSRQIQIDFV